ncbi:MAG: hypothetical protein IPK18_03110 [Sphingobacteriales bacterium]|jgi:hypothetical protein|nr:MAG: hypothetical protein IPK18_03110 [Sphingobacteriales bacterium]
MNTYTFESGTKSKILITFVIGVLILLLGIGMNALKSSKSADAHGTHQTAAEHHDATDAHAQNVHADEHGQDAHSGGHHEKPITLKSKLLANFYSLFLFGFYIALTALFFISAATIAWGGWQIQIQKIPLAISRNIFIFLGFLFLAFLLFRHDLFEWTHEYLYIKDSDTFDPILAMKRDYLNMPRFWAFFAIQVLAAGGIAFAWWKNLTQQDSNPSMKLFSKSRAISATAIVLIAFVISTFATWDWSMSIQPHWYSTLFPWYTMASAAVTMFSIVLLIIYHLKSKNLLPRVNENHTHDIAKLMFAISVFWTYLFFAQYMLIWYGNIPEETTFFINRRQLDNYGILFHATLVINFILPFFILMRRNSKRNPNVTKFMAVVIILGHWMDFYLMIGPPLVPNGGFGLISLGALLIMGSLFAFVTLYSLSKVTDLESSTHPYVKESYNLHI